MKCIKRAVCVALCAVLCAGLCSCARVGGTSYFEVDSPRFEANKICASAVRAYYNEDGTETDASGEAFETADGEFTMIVGITNSTKYTKILTDVEVNSISNGDGVVIAKEGSFELNDKRYLTPGVTEYISCVFAADEVLARVDLTTISTDITLNYYGCVKNGPAPSESDSGFTMSISEAEFDDVGGLSGKIMLKNNNKTAKIPAAIHFDILTDGGKAVTTAPVELVCEQSVAAGDTITLDFAALAANLDSVLQISRDFNTLVQNGVKITEK